MALIDNKVIPDVLLGQTARQGPSLFNEFIDYGSTASKIIGGVMEGPVGWVDAATTFGGMFEDKWKGSMQSL